MARSNNRLIQPSATQPVVVVGAGPYGLATAAHLRAARVPMRVFGDPMSFWRRNMPRGMILRSRLRSSHIAHAGRSLTIEAFEADQERSVRRPSLTRDEFVDYGRWFQRRAVPDLDERQVRRVDLAAGGFRVTLDDGEGLEASRIVIATGLALFARWPAALLGLPSDLVSHSVEHTDLSGFRNRRILVVGAGQSALESAALLHECGATVEIVARTGQVRWLPDGGVSRRQPWPLPPTDVGGGPTAWLVAVPEVFRHLPPHIRPVLADRTIPPAGAAWLRARLAQVRISTERSVLAAHSAGASVRVELDDGTSRDVDHVLVATGYDVDVRHGSLLSEGVRDRLTVTSGYPRLGRGLESSVPGLHFVGAPAAVSFGPIMRFVVGTWHAAPSAASAIAGGRRAPLHVSFPRGAGSTTRLN